MRDNRDQPNLRSTTKKAPLGLDAAPSDGRHWSGEADDVADLDCRQKIRDFIEERFLVTFGDDFAEDVDLFREGVMDSFGYVQLLRYVEKEFGVKFTETDLLNGPFVSLTQIQAHVERRMEVQAGSGKA